MMCILFSQYLKFAKYYSNDCYKKISKRYLKWVVLKIENGIKSTDRNCFGNGPKVSFCIYNSENLKYHTNALDSLKNSNTYQYQCSVSIIDS